MLQRMHNSLVVTLLLPLAISLVACSSQPVRFDEDPKIKKMAWPVGSKQPRIKYLGQFSSPEQFGIGKGFFESVVEFFTGEKDQRLIRPMSIVALSRQKIFVSDPGAKGIHYFDSEENDYRLIQLADDQPLPSPIGMTKGENGTIFVADSSLGKVFKVSADAEYAVPYNLSVKLSQPTGITYDPKRKQLVVVDTARHKIHVFDQNGKQIREFGSRGVGNKQFNYPTMVWLDAGGDLLVTDSLNFRIQRLSQKGTYLGQFGQIGSVRGKMSRPKGVATDKFGHIYIIDALIHAMQIFDKKGRLLMHIGGQGQDAGQFWLPSGIYIGENNTIFIADTYNRRIQVFQYIGVST